MSDHSPLDPFFHPYYDHICKSHCCFLQASDGRYPDARIELALPTHEGLPIYVSLPHLGVHGLAYPIVDGSSPPQQPQPAAQAEEPPLEQEHGQRTEGGGHLGHAGGADEEDGLIVAMRARLLNIIWPAAHLALRYLFRNRE